MFLLNLSSECQNLLKKFQANKIWRYKQHVKLFSKKWSIQLPSIYEIWIIYLTIPHFGRPLPTIEHRRSNWVFIRISSDMHRLTKWIHVLTKYSLGWHPKPCKSFPRAAEHVIVLTENKTAERILNSLLSLIQIMGIFLKQFLLCSLQHQ